MQSRDHNRELSQKRLACDRCHTRKLRPVRVLRGFDKVFLEAGETKAVSFALTRRDLSYWDVDAQDWRIPTGEIGISLGFSSRDLRRNSTVRII